MRGNAFQTHHFLPLLLLLTGCKGNQSIFATVSQESERIVKLWWLLFSVSMFVMALVVIALIISYIRTKKFKTPVEDKKLGQAIIIATGISTLLLLIIYLVTLKYSEPIIKEHRNPFITVEVIGYRWWWAVKYYDANNNYLFETANEIHIPVNVPVLLKLKSADVIHSLWIPNIAGKVDMIPGITNDLWINVNKEGTYRGQCAEFCGIQHAKMSLFVIGLTEKDFSSWLSLQSTPPRIPQDELAQRGQQVFKELKCIQCHTVRGLNTSQKDGPDLTKLATRKTLAAATLPNRRGHLAGWITDPQSIKPGNLMPETPIDPNDLNALLHYLENLK